MGPGGPGRLPAHVPAGGKLSHDGSQGGSRGRPSTAPPPTTQCKVSRGPHRLSSERLEEGSPLG